MSNITADGLLTWCAKRQIEKNEPSASESRIESIMHHTKYNLLCTASRAADVLLVISVASAILCAYSAAIVYGVAGFFIKALTNKIVVDIFAQDHSLLERLSLRHKSDDHNIRENLKITSKEWKQFAVYLLGYGVWRNTVSIPN